MNERPKKYGWTEKGIVGAVFTPVGLIMLIAGIAVLRLAHLEGDDRLAIQICLLGEGAVFALTGLFLLGRDLRRRRLQRSAYEGGYYVMAKIAGVRGNNRVNVNGKHPVMVECHYTDPATGTAHVYFSRYLYVQVEDLLEKDEVPLYLDRMDPAIGFVDIDAVLPEIEVHR